MIRRPASGSLETWGGGRCPLLVAGLREAQDGGLAAIDELLDRVQGNVAVDVDRKVQDVPDGQVRVAGRVASGEGPELLGALRDDGASLGEVEARRRAEL
jgi:hypothetical protein